MLLAPCLALPLFLLAAEVEVGTKLVYRGEVAAVRGDVAASRKTLHWECVVAPPIAGSERPTIIWSLVEQGRGGWAWTEQFTRAELDDGLRVRGPDQANYLYRGDGFTAMQSLTGPFFRAPEPLAEGVKWTEAQREFVVEEAIEFAGRPAWRVVGTSRTGRHQTVLVERDRPLVLAVRETVFAGQGEHFSLEFKLEREERLDEQPLAQLVAAADALVALRRDLAVTRRRIEPDWKPEQLALLRERLPSIAAQSSATMLERVVRLAEEDARFQRGRSTAIETIRKEQLGRKAPDFSLPDLDGNAVTREALLGKGTVLHFWEYQDPATEAPYGQVGFLDHLHRRQKEAGVQVFGVAVRSELSDEDRRRATIQNVKRFRDFMNLSYPILLDRGTLLAEFGDPREAEGKLPLFIVIDKHGVIREHHAGLYDTGREAGLKELEGVVKEAAK